MVPVASALRDAGYRTVFLEAEEVYHQPIFKGVEGLEVIRTGVKAPKPFYLSGAKERIRLALAFRRSVRSMLKGMDALIIGNDGSLQRLVAGQLAGKPTFLLLDGIISDYSFGLGDILFRSEKKWPDLKDYIRRKSLSRLMPIQRILPWNFLLPSEIGSMRVERIYTVGEYVRRLLVKRGKPERTVKAFGLPRFSSLVELGLKPVARENGSKLSLLLITQGYIWHNETEHDALQHLEIANLIGVLDELDSGPGAGVRLEIRIHPRDDRRAYDRYLAKPFVSISEGPLYDRIKACDAVLGFNSTVLVETLVLGKPVLVLMTQGQSWRFARSFIAEPAFEKATDRDTLVSKLKGLMDRIQSGPNAGDPNGYFIATTSPESFRE
jgi:hypothetical protein